MSLYKQMLLWNQASLKVLDVRRTVVLPGERARYARLPASAFLYAGGGRGQIWVDGVAHTIENSYVCHAGKGASLDIVRVAEPVDYFLVFYKAALMLPCRQELLELYRDRNPFQMPYGFAPVQPLPLYRQFEQLHQQWQIDDPLEKFHARALFHQLVYELTKQQQASSLLQISARSPTARDGSPAFRGDLASRAVRYIEEHYAETLSLQELAELLQCGARQLQRLFKDHYQIGPMAYLIQVRMDQAKGMLLNTRASIKEIAETVGYADAYHFSRYFKKHIGQSPLQFRRECRINPFFVSYPPIGAHAALSYNGTDDENHSHPKNEGAAVMQSRMKTLLAVNLMLIFMLVLGACSSGSSGNAAGNTGATITPAAATSPAPGASQAVQMSYPVTIKHAKGAYTLEQQPERIAVLDVQFVDQLVTLNEQPAGSVKAAGAAENFPEYLTDKLADVKVLGTYEEPNLEAILEINPDFIICTEAHEQIYDSLNQIAPTVMLLRNDDWRDTLVTFGKIMDKEQEAEQVLQAYRDKTARLTAELAAKLDGQTVALLRPRDDMIRVHTAGHRTGAILYKDLGLTVPEQVAKETDTAYHISPEALADVGADYIFLLTDDMFKASVEELQSTQVWQSLEPVKQNRVFMVDTTMWIGYYGPMAINLVIDQAAEKLLGAS